MAKQTINLGTAPTGTGGDTPRSAFTKAQANFDELYNGFYAGKGANNDITSLGALSTALRVDQGGTGNTTGTATKLAPAAIVGTVSQSGGTPTGALMQAGTIGAGSFEKYACGTMICRFDVTYTLTSGDFTAPTAGFWYFGAPWTFPAAFVSPPVVTGCARAPSKLTIVAGGDVSATAATIWLIEIAAPNAGATNYVVHFQATGRWF